MGKGMLPWVALCVAAMWINTNGAAAQTLCAGTLRGRYQQVWVDGTVCTLDGARVVGDVLVRNRGSLVTGGGAVIGGDVRAVDAGDITLAAAVVRGEVTLERSNDLFVQRAARTGPVVLRASRNAILDIGTRVESIRAEAGSNLILACGFVRSITSEDSGTVALYGATVPDGIHWVRGEGTLTICSSTVGGRVGVETSIGDVLTGPHTSCGASTLTGEVSIEGSTGRVKLAGAQLAQLEIAAHQGDITVVDTSADELQISQSRGEVLLAQVRAPGEVELEQNSGGLTLVDSTLREASMVGNAAVTLADNTFLPGGEIALELNTGPVRVESNTGPDLILEVVRNRRVSLVGNAGDTLSCNGNTPAPRGARNRFRSRQGQCRPLG